MAISLPNGSIVAIASGYSTLKVMSAVTNANPAVATLATGHGIVTADYLEVTSGWSGLNGRVTQAGTVATDSVPLLGVDTTSTSRFPAGSGTGSVKRITGWTQLSQILASSSSGGEQQFLEYQLLEGDAQQRIPTTKSASGMSFTVADDPAQAGYILALAANDDRLPRGIRITLPSGGVILYNAYMSVSRTPTLSVNEIMSVEVTLSMVNTPVRI